MTDEKTDKVEAESTKKEDVKVDSSTTDKDVKKADSSEAEVPWHKDARFKNDLALLKTAKSLMEANSLDDVDDLKELIESGKKVHGKKVDLDKLEEIAKKAATLDEYQKYWDQQKELKQRDIETPEQTIDRLERQNREITHRVTAKEQAENEAKQAKESVAYYESEVKNLLEDSETLKPDEKEFISWALGVGNECNEITITDKRAIKKVLNSGIKKYQKLVEAIKEDAIKEYRAGKASVPSVPSSDGSAPTAKPDPPKGLKGLRSAFMEAVSRKGD